MASRPPWGNTGTTGATAVTVDVRSPQDPRQLCGGLAIKNTSALLTLSLSWNGGTTYSCTLAPGEKYSTGDTVMDSFVAHSGGAACAFEWNAQDKEES